MTLSIHAGKSMDKASGLGAAGGDDCTIPLWNMSKRELIECLLHIAAQASDEGYDDAINSDGAVKRVLEEYAILQNHNLV